MAADDRYRPISREEWPDFDLPARCPICLSYHDAASNLQDKKMPKDGDVTVCIVCAGIAVFDFSLPTNLRYPNDAELAVLSKDPNIKLIQWGIRRVKDLHGPLKGDYRQPPPS